MQKKDLENGRYEKSINKKHFIDGITISLKILFK